MPRAIWTGAISFGLVTVPVKLYSAVNRKTVRFHQLSGKTGVRVAQKRVDPQTGEEVPYEDIVKGYEIAPDRYVVVEPAELDSLQPKKTKTIEIEDFVELSQIDPIFYDHPLLPRPRHRWREALPAAARGDGGDGQGRDRAGRDPLQGAAGGDPPDGRRAGDGHDAVPRRNPSAGAPGRGRRGGQRQNHQARARDRQAAGRIARRRLRAGQVPRHLPRGGARADRAQGRGQGDRGAAGGRGGTRAGARPDERAEGQPRRRARRRATATAARNARNRPRKQPRRKRPPKRARRGHRPSARCRPAALLGRTRAARRTTG